MSKIERPEYGAPCNGCAVCCTEEVCGFGSYFLDLVEKYGDRYAGRCSALIDNQDGSYGCDLVFNPKKYTKAGAGSQFKLRSATKFSIGSGLGCDSEINREIEITDDDRAKVQPLVDDKFIQQAQDAYDYWSRFKK